MGLAIGGKDGTIADLNVVPLIDILLVLLVIFMIITPLESKGLPAQIPQPQEPGRVREDPDPGIVVVEVLNNGSVRVNQQVVSWEELEERLARVFAGRVSRVAFVKAGSQVEFAQVARAIDLMRGAGITSVGLMTPGLERAPGIV
jgi:biopolymer transport protein TolR